METKVRDIYYRNGKFFYRGETDLENPRQSHRGNGVYFTGTATVPFKVLRDLEYVYHYHGSSTMELLPAGVYRVIPSGYPEDPIELERLGDDYTPEQKAERDKYWEAEKAKSHSELWFKVEDGSRLL